MSSQASLEARRKDGHGVATDAADAALPSAPDWHGCARATGSSHTGAAGSTSSATASSAAVQGSNGGQAGAANAAPPTLSRTEPKATQKKTKKKKLPPPPTKPRPRRSSSQREQQQQQQQQQQQRQQQQRRRQSRSHAPNDSKEGEDVRGRNRQPRPSAGSDLSTAPPTPSSPSPAFRQRARRISNSIDVEPDSPERTASTPARSLTLRTPPPRASADAHHDRYHQQGGGQNNQHPPRSPLTPSAPAQSLLSAQRRASVSTTPSSRTPLRGASPFHRSRLGSLRSSFRAKMRVENRSSRGMDTARRKARAYEYLCHLEEARQWLTTVLDVDLPPAEHLGERLANGVVLCKLASFFNPKKVKPRHVYDADESIFLQRGLRFRHVDNITRFLEAMHDINFPEFYHPTVTDVYDKKNTPRLIYCLHALSFFLHSMGLAPHMEDLHGIAEFSEEQIEHIDRHIDEAGVALPAFDTLRSSQKGKVEAASTQHNNAQEAAEMTVRDAEVKGEAESIRPYIVYWPFAPDPWEPFAWGEEGNGHAADAMTGAAARGGGAGEGSRGRLSLAATGGRGHGKAHSAEGEEGRGSGEGEDEGEAAEARKPTAPHRASLLAPIGQVADVWGISSGRSSTVASARGSGLLNTAAGAGGVDARGGWGNGSMAASSRTNGSGGGSGGGSKADAAFSAWFSRNKDGFAQHLEGYIQEAKEQRQDQLLAEYEFRAFFREMLPHVYDKLLAADASDDDDDANHILDKYDDDDDYREAKEDLQQLQQQSFWDHMFWGTPRPFYVAWPFRVDDFLDAGDRAQLNVAEDILSAVNDATAAKQMALLRFLNDSLQDTPLEVSQAFTLEDLIVYFFPELESPLLGEEEMPLPLGPSSPSSSSPPSPNHAKTDRQRQQQGQEGGSGVPTISITRLSSESDLDGAPASRQHQAAAEKNEAEEDADQDAAAHVWFPHLAKLSTSSLLQWDDQWWSDPTIPFPRMSDALLSEHATPSTLTAATTTATTAMTTTTATAAVPVAVSVAAAAEREDMRPSTATPRLASPHSSADEHSGGGGGGGEKGGRRRGSSQLQVPQDDTLAATAGGNEEELGYEGKQRQQHEQQEQQEPASGHHRHRRTKSQDLKHVTFSSSPEAPPHSNNNSNSGSSGSSHNVNWLDAASQRGMHVRQVLGRVRAWSRQPSAKREPAASVLSRLKSDLSGLRVPPSLDRTQSAASRLNLHAAAGFHATATATTARGGDGEGGVHGRGASVPHRTSLANASIFSRSQPDVRYLLERSASPHRSSSPASHASTPGAGGGGGRTEGGGGGGRAVGVADDDDDNAGQGIGTRSRSQPGLSPNSIAAHGDEGRVASPGTSPVAPAAQPYVSSLGGRATSPWLRRKLEERQQARVHAAEERRAKLSEELSHPALPHRSSLPAVPLSSCLSQRHHSLDNVPGLPGHTRGRPRHRQPGGVGLGLTGDVPVADAGHGGGAARAMGAGKGEDTLEGSRLYSPETRGGSTHSLISHLSRTPRSRSRSGSDHSVGSSVHERPVSPLGTRATTVDPSGSINTITSSSSSDSMRTSGGHGGGSRQGGEMHPLQHTLRVQDGDGADDGDDDGGAEGEEGVQCRNQSKQQQQQQQTPPEQRRVVRIASGEVLSPETQRRQKAMQDKERERLRQLPVARTVAAAPAVVGGEWQGREDAGVMGKEEAEAHGVREEKAAALGRQKGAEGGQESWVVDAVVSGASHAGAEDEEQQQQQRSSSKTSESTLNTSTGSDVIGEAEDDDEWL